jgi:hypothetical protein
MFSRYTLGMPDPEHKTENDARFSLYLPSDLLEWAKVKAAKERRRTNDVIVEAVRTAKREDGQ